MSFLPALFDARVLYVLLPLLLLSFSNSAFAAPATLGSLALGVAVNALQYFRLKWQVLDDKVVIQRGLVSIRQNVIPFSEIHDIDFVQNPVQKLFRVGVVTFQTSGDDGSVASIPFLPIDVIDQVKSMYTAYKSPDIEAEPEENEFHEQTSRTDMSAESHEKSVATITPWENVLLAIIRPPIGWFLGLVAIGLGALARWTQTAVTDFLEPYFDIQEAVSARILNEFPWISIDILDFVDLSSAIALVLVALMMFVLAAWTLAGAVSFLLHQNFRLTLYDETLHVISGASLRVDRKTPMHRVQMIQVIQNLRHRMLRYKSIYYDSSAPEQSSGSLFEQSFGIWLVPLIADSDVRGVTSQIMPMLNFIRDDWLSVEKRAWKRRFKRNLAILAPIVILGCLISIWFAILAIPLLVLDWYLSSKYVASISYAVAHEGILVRKGWWVRRESAVPFEKIQGVVLKQTLFDRVNEMQKVCIDIAAHDSRRFAIEIPYLQDVEAGQLAKKIANEAQIRRFEW